MSLTKEEADARRRDYQEMYARLRAEDTPFPLPRLQGYPSHDAHLLTRYVLDVREANGQPLTPGQLSALEGYMGQVAHNTVMQALRRELRARASQQRLMLQATYDAAFRAGYRARKILQDSNSQRSFHKGYARGIADAQAARDAE